MASSFDQLLAGPISYSAAPRRPVVDIAICLYALSNIALHFVGESCFHELKFNVSLKRSRKNIEQLRFCLATLFSALGQKPLGSHELRKMAVKTPTIVRKTSWR